MYQFLVLAQNVCVTDIIHLTIVHILNPGASIDFLPAIKNDKALLYNIINII